MNRGKLDAMKQMKHWKCDANPAHILGVLKRVESKVNVDGHVIRYWTTQVMLFKKTVNLDAEIPDEIEVAGYVDGLMLVNMVWACTCCGAVKRWHPGEEALLWLKSVGRING